MNPLRSALLAIALTAVGCHGQTPADASGKLSAETTRRVEILIRSRSKVPPNYTVTIGPRSRSDVPGFDTIPVTFSADGKSTKPALFLLSTDGKTLAQFNKFDIGKDPKELVSSAERPARGGPATATVVIVGFDDLECPFCAKMHQQLFPALLDRYKDQVRVVYRDYPLVEIHPWAMRAAIDTNCVGAQSQTGYWNLIDYIHAHASELGGAEKSIAKAHEMLDTLAREEAQRQHLKMEPLQACIAKQDETVVRASMRDADALGVEATPVLFINGEKIDGAVPLADVYRAVDDALVAAGQTPLQPPSSLHRRSSPATSSKCRRSTTWQA